MTNDNSTYVCSSEGPVASTALATTNDFHNYKRLEMITKDGSDNIVLFQENIKNICVYTDHALW
jgi:predicted GH43/DUF377 family glycosyl hydrolase